MSFRALVYAYIIGGFTFIPLVIATLIFYTIYTSVPVDPSDPSTVVIDKKDGQESSLGADDQESPTSCPIPPLGPDLNDAPKQRKGWLTVRRTFGESSFDGSYVTLMKSFLDARSKDPKKSRPKDEWYVALKGKVLYLYEDEAMTECEAAIELGGHDVVIYPETLLDGELFTKRNAICLRPKPSPDLDGMPSITKEVMTSPMDGGDSEVKNASLETAVEEKKAEVVREQAFDASAPWFIFVRSTIEMEDWYFALIHASDHPANTPTLNPLHSIFDPSDMAHLVETLDEQPDVIPMRWLNALIGRIFFSYYRTHVLEEYIIGRLMKKLSKVKRPAFLTEVVVAEVSVGNTAPVLSKPMLKALTKEGEASLEVHLQYKGEVRITVQAVATINLGARFKSYSVKLVLAVVLREIEGNLLVKVKRPPSNRIWYAFTQPPRMILDVEPVVSDRQITWNMVLSSIEARLKEIIMESVVMPNMDDIAFFQSSDYIHRGGIWADALRREKHTTPDSDPTQPIQTLYDGGASVASTSSAPAVLPVQEIKPVLGRARSAEELREEESVSIADKSMARAATLATPGSSPSTSTASKRRTWLSSVLGEEAGSDSDENPDNVSRGRATNSTTPSSSRSTSSNSDLPDHPDENILLPKRPPPLPPRTPPVKDTSEGPSSTPPKSPQLPRTGTAASGTSPTSSFFSTLKARASDKQALSNSAKEAMKKWSANWSALRRDNADDSPDTGGQDRSTSEPTRQNKRANYADIRKNVEDRQRTVDPGDLRPVDILNGEGRVVNKQRDLRASSISAALAPLAENSASVSSDGRDGSSSTELHASADDAFRDAAVESPTPLPVRTQPPQAKTMTIPGIHASHRGEVMSLGYVAEPLQPLESKSKTPAMQSMYRLWKNAGSSNQVQNQDTESETSGHPKEPDVLQTRSKPPPAPPRMVPPPLPPRSVSTNITRSVETAAPDVLDAGASAALKSVATQDESRRGSVDREDVSAVSQVDPVPPAHSSASS